MGLDIIIYGKFTDCNLIRHCNPIMGGTTSRTGVSSVIYSIVHIRQDNAKNTVASITVAIIKGGTPYRKRSFGYIAYKYVRCRKKPLLSERFLFYQASEKTSLPSPQTGQVQSSETSSQAVPGATPLSGSPTAGSYT